MNTYSLFHDVSPKAPIHVLVIPHVKSKALAGSISKLWTKPSGPFWRCREVATKLGLEAMAIASFQLWPTWSTNRSLHSCSHTWWATHAMASGKSYEWKDGSLSELSCSFLRSPLPLSPDNFHPFPETLGWHLISPNFKRACVLKESDSESWSWILLWTVFPF